MRKIIFPTFRNNENADRVKFHVNIDTSWGDFPHDIERQYDWMGDIEPTFVDLEIPSSPTPREITITMSTTEGWAFENTPLEFNIYVDEYNNETGDYDYVNQDFTMTGTSLEQSVTFDIRDWYINDFPIPDQDGSWTPNQNDWLTGLEMIPDSIAPVEDMPFLHVYEINQEQLDGLNKERFEIIHQRGDSVAVEEVDTGKYITGLFRVPYLDNVEKVETNILLGDTLSSVKANQLDKYISNIEIGNISIEDESLYGLPFSNIEIDLFVPYFNKIPLNVEDVLHQTITLTVNLNLMTGKGTLNIYNSKTGTVIEIVDTKISETVPYELNNRVSINIGSDVSNTDFNKAYVQVKKQVPNNSLKLYDIPKVELSNEFNYMKDNEVMIQSKATDKEQKQIKDLINKGVFIRK